MSDEKQLPPCDAEVFENGESIGLFPGIKKEDVERLCKGLSAVTGWRIDWSYFAGRPHIRALAPAQQHQGEPVAYLCKAEGAKWLQYGSKVGSPWKPGEVDVTPLFTHADPGEVERLRIENEAFDAGMRNLACQLSAGGYNAESLTADQLLEKVQWGLTHLTEAQARLVAQLQADLTERDQQIDALRQGMKGDYDLDAWLAFVEEAPQLRLDAERYRWLRDKAHTADWEFIGGQTPDAGEAEIDAAMAKEVQT